MGCGEARETYVVADLPASDRPIGDLIVNCGDGCPRDYAVNVLLQLAREHRAARVSSLSCVQRGQAWLCVGRASRPAACDEGV